MTAGLISFHSYINVTAIALSYLLVVLGIAATYGSGPAYLASVLGVLAFNFFFLPPLYTLVISDPQNWIALVAFLITALVAGQLSSYARRRAEESEERQLEIERLYDELKSAFEEASKAEGLRQSEQLKSALLDAVTHDLRTPLTSIKACVTTLIEGRKALQSGEHAKVVVSTEDGDELLDLINEETDRLNEFIGGIVELAQVEAGRIDSRKIWHEVAGIIDNSVERARLRLEFHELATEIADELPLIKADAAAISEVIYVFLDNAAKYSPRSSTIRISASRGPGETVEISVEDQGAGIDLGTRERVFDKFFRSSGNDIHATVGGLGIGLAIARGVSESQGGEVWVEDGHNGFATRFVFRLPVGDDESGKETGLNHGTNTYSRR